MAFGHFTRGADEPVAEINVIPLVDVMLVLLVIFIVTAPVMTHAVKVELPKASSTPNAEEQKTDTLTLDAEGRLHWNNETIDDATLAGRVAGVAREERALQIRADAAVPYRRVARVMAEASRAGVSRLGLITEPEP